MPIFRITWFGPGGRRGHYDGIYCDVSGAALRGDVRYGDAFARGRQFPKLRIGNNPLSGTSRLKLTTDCMYRESGRAGRKLPFMIGEVMSLRGLGDLKATGRRISRSKALMGMFSMLRMGKLLIGGKNSMSTERHQLHMRDI